MGPGEEPAVSGSRSHTLNHHPDGLEMTHLERNYTRFQQDVEEWTLAIETATSWPEDKRLPSLRDFGQWLTCEFLSACSVKWSP